MTRHRHPIAPIALALLALAPAIAAATEDPLAAVDRYFAAYRSGDPDAMVAAYTADALFEDVVQRNRAKGAEELSALFAKLTALHEAMDTAIERRVVDGDTVVVEYRYTGALSGDALCQMLGKHDCADLEYSLPVTSWFTIRNGKIAAQRDFIDLASYQELQKKAFALGTPATGDGEQRR